jgi:hypothetical protein
LRALDLVTDPILRLRLTGDRQEVYICLGHGLGDRDTNHDGLGDLAAFLEAKLGRTKVDDCFQLRALDPIAPEVIGDLCPDGRQVTLNQNRYRDKECPSSHGDTS